MPTDPNNLKQYQIVAVRMVALGSLSDDEDHVLLEDGMGCQYFFRRADIITDYPPEPSAEGEWEALNDYALDGYEYRVQRRSIKPAWKPEVGRDVMFEKNKWELIATRDEIGWIARKGYTRLQPLSDLTQPKEDAAK